MTRTRQRPRLCLVRELTDAIELTSRDGTKRTLTVDEYIALTDEEIAQSHAKLVMVAQAERVRRMLG